LRAGLLTIEYGNFFFHHQTGTKNSPAAQPQFVFSRLALNAIYEADMAKTTIRTYARRLGLRANEGNARVAFEGDTPNQLIRKMWSEIEHARKGTGIYISIQPFGTIEKLVEKYGSRIWGPHNRDHLLAPHEKPDYRSDLFWEYHMHQYVPVQPPDV
jgi:hypothetical protein